MILLNWRWLFISFLRKIYVKNGNNKSLVNYYECNNCEEEIFEAHPHYQKDNKDFHLCLDCAFKKDKFTEKEYLFLNGIVCDNFNASIHKGQVKIHQGKPPWEIDNQDLRNTQKYKKWRLKVFKRDDYTCTHCGKRGGNLNAHHIKSFANFPDLRFKLENGITLCKKCHKKEHSTGGD